jgi:hypothetical protein
MSKCRKRRSKELLKTKGNRDLSGVERLKIRGIDFAHARHLIPRVNRLGITFVFLLFIMEESVSKGNVPGDTLPESCYIMKEKVPK